MITRGNAASASTVGRDGVIVTEEQAALEISSRRCPPTRGFLGVVSQNPQLGTYCSASFAVWAEVSPLTEPGNKETHKCVKHVGANVAPDCARKISWPRLIVAKLKINPKNAALLHTLPVGHANEFF